MSDRNLLFYVADVHDFLNANKARAKQAVEQISGDQLTASSDDQVIEYVLSQVRIEPLVLHEDHRTFDSEESQMDVSRDFRYGGFGDEPAVAPAVLVRVMIPFTGDGRLWDVKPTPYYMNFPRASVLQRDHRGVGKLVLTIKRTTHADPAEFPRELEERLKLIRDFLVSLLNNVAQHNSELPATIRERLHQRRQRLDKMSAIKKVLDIPMTPRPGAPTIEPLPAPRKIVRPLPSALPDKPEWALPDNVYEHVLQVIRHEGVSFETTPGTFNKLDEEELRDVILAHLNGHYQGDASGERFRKHGKTDICIEVENRAAFVGECKVWRGGKDCAAAADQLLSYVTWRDSKCALVFFNKTVKGFTDVQAAAAEALRGHPLFVSDAGGAPPGEWRFRFRQKDDEKRIVTVHVFLFNLVLTPRGKV